MTDDVDGGGSFLALFTPAFTRSILGCCVKATPDTDIQVQGGSRNVVTVETEIEGLWQKEGLPPPNFYVSSVTEAKAERSIQPQSIALAVFGGIAGLSALLIVSQAIARSLRRGADDLSIPRALGASTSMNVTDGRLGVGVSIVIGSMLALAMATGLSLLAPIGVVRPVYPHPGISYDWTVLATGTGTTSFWLGEDRATYRRPKSLSCSITIRAWPPEVTSLSAP